MERPIFNCACGNGTPEGVVHHEYYSLVCKECGRKVIVYKSSDIFGDDVIKLWNSFTLEELEKQNVK